jgi:hypothetical protein
MRGFLPFVLEVEAWWVKGKRWVYEVTSDAAFFEELGFGFVLADGVQEFEVFFDFSFFGRAPTELERNT